MYIIKNDSIRRITEKNRLSDDIVTTIAHDKNGTWVGTRNGLNYIYKDSIKTFSIKNGLISNYIRSIAISSRNEVWLGTFDGISIIKTNKIENITQEDGLVSNAILELFIDKNNNTWVNTVEGISMIRNNDFIIVNEAQSNRFKSLYVTPGGKAYLGSNQGYIIIDTNDSYILKQSPYTKSKDIQYSEGILYIATNNGLIIKNLNSNKEKTLLTNYKIYSIYLSSDKRLWIGTNHGLFIYENEAIFDYTDSHDGIPFRINKIYQDKKNNIWFATNKGLYYYDGIDFYCYLSEDGLLDDYTISIIEDSQGRIWQGTRKGITILENNHWRKFNQYPHFNNDVIKSMNKDSQNRIWINTKSRIIIYDNNDFTIYTPDNVFNNAIINHITEDKTGQVWFATNEGVIIFNNKEYKYYPYYLENSTKTRSINKIIPISSNSAWLATETGLAYYQNGEISSYQENDHSISWSIHAIYEDSKETIWLGGNYGLIKKTPDNKKKVFSIKNGSISSRINRIKQKTDNQLWLISDAGIYYIENDSIHPFPQFHLLKDKIVNDVIVDSMNRIWLACDDGLYYVQENNIHNVILPDWPQKGRVRQLHIDRNNLLWAGTTQGLFSIKDSTINKYSSLNGLLDNECHTFIIDQNNNIWIGTWNVLTRFDGINFYHYQKEDGIPAGLIIDLKLDSTGNLWILTRNSLVKYQTKINSEQSQSPPIYISKVSVNGIPVNIQNNQFNYSEHNLHISFIGLEYSYPKKIKYEYRLLGLDSSWIRTNLPFANYTLLPPGDYVFEVNSVNHKGLMSDVPAVYEFTIDKPYWKKWWFRSILILIVFIFLSITALIIRFFSIKKINARLEQLVKEKISDLAQANMKLKKLANLDGLTNIPNYRNFALHYNEEWNRCIRNKTPLALLMLDIDDFKLYNDTYGHLQGDICLKTTAQILHYNIKRAGELAARYGGEEFIAVLPNTTLKESIELAEKIKQQIETADILILETNKISKITISIGAASIIPKQSISKEVLIKKADDALYKAKNSGKNKVFY